MRRLVVLTVILGLFVALSPASAVTRTGKATDSRSPTWEVYHGPGGMLIMTIYWKTKRTKLFLAGACDDGSQFVSGSLEDRFSHLQIEVDPDTTCDVEVRSRGGSSKFWINFRGSGVFSASAGSEAVLVTRSKGRSTMLNGISEQGKGKLPR